MDKRNHFSDKFKPKSSEELRQIISNKDYQKEAQLAAIWELERREEATKTEQVLAEKATIQQATQRESIKLAKKYQTFGPRFIAAFLDGLVLMLITWLINLAILRTDQSVITFILGILYNFLPFLYSTLMHGYNGQTLGKMAMNIRVVSFVSEDKISYFQAFLRDSVPIILMLLSYSILALGTNGFSDRQYIDSRTFPATHIAIIIINGLNFLWVIIELITMLMNEKSRAVHDLIAKTVVIRTD